MLSVLKPQNKRTHKHGNIKKCSYATDVDTSKLKCTELQQSLIIMQIFKKNIMNDCRGSAINYKSNENKYPQN